MPLAEPILEKSRTITVAGTNFLPVRRTVTLRVSPSREVFTIEAGADFELKIEIDASSRYLEIDCSPVRPINVIARSTDTRELGVAIRWIDFED